MRIKRFLTGNVSKLAKRVQELFVGSETIENCALEHLKAELTWKQLELRERESDGAILD